MTLGQFLGGAAPSGAQYYDNYPTGSSDAMFMERDGGSPDFSFSSSKKSKKASEKKQLAFSALTLLAFLFFLNILQTCLKEQTEADEVPAMMVVNAAQFQAVKSRSPEDELEETQDMEIITKVKRDIYNSRRLLQVDDAIATTEATRTSKFIEHYQDKTWKNDLTKLTGDELKEQNIKTQILSILKKTKNDAKTSGTMKSIEFQNERKRQKNVADFDEFVVGSEVPKVEVELTQEPTSKPSLQDPSPLSQPHVFDLGTQGYFQAQTGVLNTPRTRRSDITTTTQSLDGDIAEFKKNLQIQEEAKLKEQNEQKTTTTPVPYAYQSLGNKRYKNHKYEDDKFEKSSPLEEYKFQSNLKKVMMKDTTPPKKVTSSYKPRKPDTVTFTTEASIWPRPQRRRNQQTKPYHPTYANNPYRRQQYYNKQPTGVYTEEYYENPGANFMTYVWSFISSVTNPISKLMPKIGQETGRQHCFGLLVCEAQRAGRYMGPSAQTMADTLGEVLGWIAPTEEREEIIRAKRTAQFNTCQDQIDHCEASHGRSPLTMIARVMEQRLGSEQKSELTKTAS